VEVKIGVVDTPRELVIASGQTPDEVEALVTDAMKNSNGLLTLVDDKGRRYILPTARVAYVQIDVADSRRVGFAVGE
jgi:Protein of unknown function (DUF3107)